MTLIQTTYPNPIALHAVKQEVHSALAGALASVFKKLGTELKPKPKQKLLRCKTTVHVVTLNVRTLNRLGPPLELRASAAEHNTDILCI